MYVGFNGGMVYSFTRPRTTGRHPRGRRPQTRARPPRQHVRSSAERSWPRPTTVTNASHRLVPTVPWEIAGLSNSPRSRDGFGDLTLALGATERGAPQQAFGDLDLDQPAERRGCHWGRRDEAMSPLRDRPGPGCVQRLQRTLSWVGCALVVARGRSGGWHGAGVAPSVLLRSEWLPVVSARRLTRRADLPRLRRPGRLTRGSCFTCHTLWGGAH